MQSNLEFQKTEYYKHIESVYIITFLVYPFYLLAFYIASKPWVVFMHLPVFFCYGACLILNRKNYLKSASFLFFLTINLSMVLDLYLFGFDAGFTYYGFSVCVLLIYSNLTTRIKRIGILLEILWCNAIFYFTYGHAALFPLIPSLVHIFSLVNLTINIVGVSNSVYRYLSIAASAQKEILSLAMKDYLTNLTNRTALNLFLEEASSNEELQSKNMGFLMIDIDHFKKINDSFGHTCGDFILKKIADIIRNLSTSYHVAARYGGEEFIYIIPINSLKDLDRLSEDLRHRVENTFFQWKNEKITVTISIGGVLKNYKNDLSYEKIIEMADECLYQAKRTGRNRVISKEI